jgi:hypothetical protein
MKTSWLVGALVCALMVPASGGAQDTVKKQTTSKKPVLDIPRLNYDFGETFPLDTYPYAFTIRNRGTADLVIEEVKPGCGCTAAKFDKVIAPGQEGKIELVVDGKKVQGQFTKAAEVKTNDPDRPQASISISAKVVPYVKVAPEGTVYLHSRPGEKVEKQLTITSNEKDLDFQVTKVTSNIDDKISYSVAKGAKKGEYVVKVAKDPKLPILSTYGSLVLHTNSQKVPTTALQVHVMTKSAIMLSPTVLNYGSVKFTDATSKGAPSSKTVTITNATGKFKITEVETSNPNFTAAVNTVTPDQQYRVTVTFTPPTRKQAKQTESGEMIIHTDDPQEPSLRVQLLARAE